MLASANWRRLVISKLPFQLYQKNNSILILIYVHFNVHLSVQIKRNASNHYLSTQR
jgi:hypothetical protein